MSDIESLVREALAHAPEREPDAIPDWTAIGRPPYRGLMIAAALGLIAVLGSVGMMLVVGRDGTHPSFADDQRFVDGGRSLDTTTEAALAAPLDTSGWQVHVDELAQLRLRFPPDWVGGPLFTPRERFDYGFGHGDADFGSVWYPMLVEVSLFTTPRPGTTSCQQYRVANPDQFTASYLAEHEDICASGHTVDDRLSGRHDGDRRAGIEVHDRALTVGGRPAWIYRLTYPAIEDGFPEISRGWCAPTCEKASIYVDWHDGWLITIDIVSPDRANYSEYVREAFTLVRSIERSQSSQDGQ